MAFFQLALKARRIERARLKYEDEKLRSIEISKGAKPHYTISQRIRRRKIRCKRLINKCWQKLTSCPEDTWFHQKAVLLRTDGTFENYILKSVIGFFGGMFLTYIFFLFFVFQLNFTLSSATMLCSMFGVILTLGLAFSNRVRCVVFLLLPQFFSKRGRQALIAYAFILAITGPAKNTLHNTGVLSESLACVQEQLKEAVKTLMDLIKQPFRALGDAVSKVIKTMKTVVKKIKQTLLAIKRIVLSILRVIKSVFEWLGSVVNICNKKLGTPFDRCERVFEGAVMDCKAKLGPVFGGICNMTYIVSAVCYVVKPLDFICMLVSYVADNVVGSVRKKIKRFTKQMKAMFYVKVEFSRSYHFETNQSRSFEEIRTGIATEIRSRADRFLAVFDWMSFATSFFMLFMLLRVIHYRHKWLTSERFDNRYLTEDLRTIDLIRARQDKETVLPLNRRERNKYIPLTSIRLIKIEKVKLTKSAIFLGLTTLKLCIHMMADYSLYWTLSTIRYYGRFETKVQQPNSVGIYVAGNGYLAELYRSIVKAFSPSIDERTIDSIPCLPDPIPPDFDRYAQILSLIIFSWLMAIFEPYGLRLRTVVMCYYHPDRAKQRATWLYNHIIRSRGSFLKYARRQLRRKFGIKDGEKIERVTLRDRFEAMCPFLRKIFPRKETTCLLCGSIERNKDTPHVKCPTPGCVGLFCIQCFQDLQNLCTICRSPMEYGDLSDFSEERDSSEDQLTTEKPKRVRKEKKIVKLDKKLKEEKMIGTQDDEKIVKDVAEQTDKGFEDAEESSTDSAYSYTYQNESPEEPQVVPQRVPFRDVEAQKIRDDVTIQIFNEPYEEASLTSSETPTPSCFVIRAHRKIRAKLKRKPRPLPSRKDHWSSSTSTADTNSLSPEDVDEDEVIHVEVDRDSRESLLSDRECRRKKQSRVKRIIGALARIPWLGKAPYEDSRTRRTLRRRRPSLMEKIVCMLQRKQHTSPVQTYRRIRKLKDATVCKRSSSSSSSSYLEGDEDRALLHDRATSMGRLIESRKDIVCCSEDVDGNVYTKSYDSDARRRKIKKDTGPRSPKYDNIDLQYPHEKKFKTKDLPSYIEPLAKGTSYREVDETQDSQSIPKCVREEDDINALSHAGTSSDGRKNDAWNITKQDDLHESCSCTTERTADTSPGKVVDSTSMRVIDEHTSEHSVADSKTEETEETSGESENLSHSEESTQNENTGRNTGGEINDETSGRSNSNSGLPENSTDEFSTETSSSPKKETICRSRGGSDKGKSVDSPTAGRSGKKIVRRTIRRPQVYDPLAGLELYGQQYRKEDTIRHVEEEVSDKREEKEVKDQKNIYSEKKKDFWKIRETQTEGDREQLITKSDKATDLIDKTRGTQTKFKKRQKVVKKSDEEDCKCTEIATTHRSNDTAEKSPRKWKKHREKKSGSKQKKRTTYLWKYYEGDRERSKKRDRKRDKSGEKYCDKSTQDIQQVEAMTETLAPKFKSIIYDREAPKAQRASRGEEICVRCRHVRRSCPCNVPSDFADLETRDFLCQYRPCSPRRNFGQKRFEYPMLKRYLPVCQRPELIEELKAHDRMKLIREREARRRFRRAVQTTRDVLARPVIRDEESSDDIVACRSPETSCPEEEKRLPYQETENFKRVVCEFQKKSLPVKEQSEESEPLISVSRRADKTKEVQQLFPPVKENRRSSIVSRFSTRLSNNFKSVNYKGQNVRDEKQYLKLAKIRDTNRYRNDMDRDPEASTSGCKCLTGIVKDNSTEDDTTDNNEITK